MGLRLEYSANYKRHLDALLSYISEELYNKKAAERLYNAINKTLSDVKEYPEMFPLHHLDSLKRKKYRFVTVENYVILYRINDDKQIIYVADIVYGHRLS